MESKKDLGTSLQALSVVARQKLGPPPTAEELLAYQRGELAPEQEERIRDLLAVYPESLRDLLDLAAHTETPGEAGYLTEEDLQADWRKLERRLRLEQSARAEEPSGGVVVPFPAPARIRLAQLWYSPALAAAAILALVSLGLGGWVVKLRERVAELGEPRVGVHRQELLPSGERGKGGAALPTVLAPAAAGHFLILTLIEERRFPDYRLEILDPEDLQGEPRWRREGLVRRGDDTFELFLPHGFLPPGEYLLRLYGLGNGPPQPLADYWVRL